MQNIRTITTRPSGGRLFFHGRAGTLFGFYVVNLFLTIITLGVYYFWARVKIRAYLLSQTEYDGDRFTWHGTGKELLVGFIKIAALFLILFGATLAIRFGWHHPAREPLLSLGGYIIWLFLIPAAMVGARRYRLSRVSWRGIRFSFRGRAREFIRIFIGGALLSVITAGLYYPFFQSDMRRYLVNHSFFGTVPFVYDGRGRDLFTRFLLTLVLAVGIIGGAFVLSPVHIPSRSFRLPAPLAGIAPTAGAPTPGGMTPIDPKVMLPFIAYMLFSVIVLFILWLWYAAYRHRYYWAHTSFAGARFRSTVFAGRLFWLTYTNQLLFGVTLGLALPWVLTRNLRFLFANVSLEGPLNLAAIQQDARAASAAGGALGDAVDIGFLDVDLAV
ncbi:MAG TPA: YjgN family protein [bacterium]